MWAHLKPAARVLAMARTRSIKVITAGIVVPPGFTDLAKIPSGVEHLAIRHVADTVWQIGHSENKSTRPHAVRGYPPKRSGPCQKVSTAPSLPAPFRNSAGGRGGELPREPVGQPSGSQRW